MPVLACERVWLVCLWESCVYAVWILARVGEWVRRGRLWRPAGACELEKRKGVRK